MFLLFVSACRESNDAKRNERDVTKEKARNFHLTLHPTKGECFYEDNSLLLQGQ
jgi:hypothetical protein